MSAALLLAAALAASASAPKAPAVPAAARVSDDDRRRALLLADLLADGGRTAEAEAFILERMALGLDAPAWTLRLARLRSGQGRHEEAAELYRRLLSGAPDDVGLMMRLAQAEAAAGRPGEARRLFLAAREKSTDPALPYYLAELAFDAGDDPEGRRWAEAALKELPPRGKPDVLLMRLRLRGRLGFGEAEDAEYAALAERHPDHSEFLTDRADALVRAGYALEAAEPLALLRERFPGLELRWRRREAARLRAAGDERARRRHFEESLERFPEEPDFLYPGVVSALSRRRWDTAEALALRLSSAPGYGPTACELLADARRWGWHHAGPLARWKESSDSRGLELGASWRGVPAPWWRARAEVSREEHRSGARRAKTAGGLLELARDRERWEAGAELDLRAGDAPAALSPGLFGTWRPAGDAYSAEGRLSLRRSWRDSPQAVVAGALSSEAEGVLRARPLGRLALAVQGRYNRVTARAGGRAVQTQLAPEAVLALLNDPLFVGLGYRYSHVTAAGDDLFFVNLPLSRRSRIHSLALALGGSWLCDRLKADAYVFNGHEPERGRRFGQGNLVGFGVNAAWTQGPLVAAARYSASQEDALGTGGKSSSAELSLSWRWGPRRPGGKQ